MTRFLHRPGRKTANAVLACILLALLINPAHAQSSGWSQPILVFEGDGLISAPTIVADNYGQVHGFWVFTPKSASGKVEREIYYTRLDRTDWTPVNIVVSSDNLVGLTAAADGQRLSLLWDGDTFTWAEASPPPSPGAWAYPLPIQSGYPNAGLQVAPDGALWTVYGSSDVNAVFVRRQDPVYHLWGKPIKVADTQGVDTAADAPRLALSAEGATLHAVWAEYQLPNGWPPLGAYYSRSADRGLTWSTPTPLAGDVYNQPNVATGSGLEVYLTWVGIAGKGVRYFQESRDGGVVFGPMEQIITPQGGGGSEGATTLLVDSAGSVHAIFSLSPCLYYASRVQGEWTEPECISSALPVAVTHLEAPSAALGLGNRLHVLFWANDNQLWYMTRTLSAPGQPPLPLPTSAPLPEPTPMATLLPSPMAPTQFETGNPANDSGSPRPAQTSMLAIAAGIVPVAILFLVLFLGRRRR